MPYKRKRKTAKRKSTPKTAAEERNAHIFRLRGFYANAKTLPFSEEHLGTILDCVDEALEDLGAMTQTEYMAKKGN